MNRPEVRNAMNAEMLCRLADAWQDVNDDAEVRVAILTGAGDEAFCAGADLGEFIPMMQGLKPPKNEYDERVKNDPGIIFRGLLRGYDVYKPIIAALNGHCYAGGTEILQATDIRVVAEDARLAISEVKRSLFPMGGSTVRLVRQIPWAVAMEILLTGEPVSAQEALRIGLVNKVVPAARVMEEAHALRADPRRERAARGAGGEEVGARRQRACRSRRRWRRRWRSASRSRAPRTRAKGRARSRRSASRCSKGSRGGVLRPVVLHCSASRGETGQLRVSGAVRAKGKRRDLRTGNREREWGNPAVPSPNPTDAPAAYLLRAICWSERHVQACGGPLRTFPRVGAGRGRRSLGHHGEPSAAAAVAGEYADLIFLHNPEV